MNIAVLGAGGMLGTDLVAELRRRGHEVRGYSKAEVDITKVDQINRAISGDKPDVIINCAAFTRVDDCESNEDLAMKVNGEAVQNILSAIGARHIRVIHLSTDYVFSGDKSTPYTEEDPSKPINAYGRSKAAGERILREWNGSYAIIRTQWLYGKGGPNFVKTILRAAKEKGKLSVVDDQIGSPTYTKDLSLGITEIIERNGTGIFHIRNEDYVSWYDWAEEILRLTGLQSVTLARQNSNDLHRPAKRPLNGRLSMERYLSLAGCPLPHWKEALTQYLASRNSN